MKKMNFLAFALLCLPSLFVVGTIDAACGCDAPKPVVTCPAGPTGLPGSNGLPFQIEYATARTVFNGAVLGGTNIPFSVENSIVAESDNVTFNAANNSFSINSPGIYYAQFGISSPGTFSAPIPQQASLTVDGVPFATINATNSNQLTTASRIITVNTTGTIVIAITVPVGSPIFTLGGFSLVDTTAFLNIIKIG